MIVTNSVSLNNKIYFCVLSLTYLPRDKYFVKLYCGLSICWDRAKFRYYKAFSGADFGCKHNYAMVLYGVD